jgi:hypothetical protein
MVSSPPTFRRFGTPPTPFGAWQRMQAKATYRAAPSLTCWLTATAALVPPGAGEPLDGASGVAKLAQPAAITNAATSAGAARATMMRFMRLPCGLVTTPLPRS